MYCSETQGTQWGQPHCTHQQVLGCCSCKVFFVFVFNSVCECHAQQCNCCETQRVPFVYIILQVLTVPSGTLQFSCSTGIVQSCPHCCRANQVPVSESTMFYVMPYHQCSKYSAYVQLPDSLLYVCVCACVRVACIVERDYSGGREVVFES